jgi:hypothetical protein
MKFLMTIVLLLAGCPDQGTRAQDCGYACRHTNQVMVSYSDANGCNCREKD